MAIRIPRRMRAMRRRAPRGRRPRSIPALRIESVDALTDEMVRPGRRRTGRGRRSRSV